MRRTLYRLKHRADLAYRCLLRRICRNDNIYLWSRHMARLFSWSFRGRTVKPTAPLYSRRTFKPPRYMRVDSRDVAKAVASLDFRSEDGPAVSVIVPVYGNPRYLAECLLSLARHSDSRIPIELIVADDRSPNDSCAFAAAIPGVRYTRNASNLGFIRNCNRAVEAARGPLLLFLNSDVVVFPGWLGPLTYAMNFDARVGAAAPMLLNDDGSLQESGVRLDSGLRPERLGHMGYPDDPAYASSIDVDYCSGACLITRRELFARVGGFSEYLRGAYWEDVDYCLKIRREGSVVRRVPASRVLHHENASYEPARHGKLMEENYRTLQVVWKGASA